jgi:predicted transcriptional regulator
MTDFRQQIRTLMFHKGATIYSTAKAVDFPSFSTLYNYLSGKSEMTTENLAKVLDVLSRLPDREEEKIT